MPTWHSLPSRPIQGHTQNQKREHVRTHTGRHTDAGGHSRDTSPAGQMPAGTQAHSSHRHECIPCRLAKAGRELPTPEPGGALCPVPTLVLLSSSWGPSGTAAREGQLHCGHRAGSGGLRNPVCPPPQGAVPLPLLGLGCSCPLPTYLHRAPQGRTHTHKCTAQPQVKQ